MKSATNACSSAETTSSPSPGAMVVLLDADRFVDERRRIEHRHDLRDHLVAVVVEPRHVVAAERILHHVDQAPVAVAARLCRPILAAREYLRQVVIGHEGA